MAFSERHSHSSEDWSSQCNSMMLHGDEENGAMPWLSEDDDDFGYPQVEDLFQTDDYPFKRRQRRQRLHSLHCYVARTGVVAVAASASMLAQQVENMARAEGISHLQQEDAHGPNGHSTTFSSIIASVHTSFACSVGGVAARVGGLASNLANAIGEPPQRVLDGSREDAPLLLFWAINLCALCSLASLALFIAAFAFSASPEDAAPEAVDPVQLAPQLPLEPNNTTAPVTAESKKLVGIFRVLGVVSLSLMSGCGLGLSHPLQSALLAGF
jgi:hypothetical protein